MQTLRNSAESLILLLLILAFEDRRLGGCWGGGGDFGNHDLNGKAIFLPYPFQNLTKDSSPQPQHLLIEFG